MQSTFTVLVTIHHDADQGVSPSRIAEITQCALEEGTSQSGSFYSAQVDAFPRKHVTAANMDSIERQRFERILPLHRERTERPGESPADKA